LEELNQLIGITLMNSGFLEMFGSQCQFPNARFASPADAHGIMAQCENTGQHLHFVHRRCYSKRSFSNCCSRTESQELSSFS